jgi:hypothetical protein
VEVILNEVDSECGLIDEETRERVQSMRSKEGRLTILEEAGGLLRKGCRWFTLRIKALIFRILLGFQKRDFLVTQRFLLELEESLLAERAEEIMRRECSGDRVKEEEEDMNGSAKKLFFDFKELSLIKKLGE